MTALRHTAREVINFTEEQVWGLDALGPEHWDPVREGVFHTIEFDDGPMEVDVRTTIFSWYCLTFHRMYPDIPVFKAHHQGHARLGSKAHLNLLGRGLFTAFDHYRAAGQWLDMEVLTREVYLATNRIYNVFSYRLEDHVTSISILDFIEVVKHPAIAAANRAVINSQASIDATYAVIRKTLKDPNEFRGNAVAKSSKSELVSMGQTQQVVGPRGRLSDIGSQVFPHAVLTGYVHGLHNLHDSMVESRSASKALEFAKDPVALTEYFNRKMRLGASTFKNLYHYIDCGNQEGYPFTVHSTDFDQFCGKAYRFTNDPAEPWQYIREDDRAKLLGKPLIIRSMFRCKNGDPNGVCGACLGDMAFQVPAETNIGYVGGSVVCEEISQNVISTKHLDQSANVDEMILSEYEEQYLQVCADPNQIKLNSNLAGAELIMTLDAASCPHLSDINKARTVRSLTIGRVSELREITLTVTQDGVTNTVILPVSMGSRLSSLTHEALMYIKETSWSLTPNGDYQIDLSYIDIEEPLFELPLKQVNMLDFMKMIEFFLRSAKKPKDKKHLKVLKDYATPEEGALALFEIISSKLKVNIAWLEVIVKCMMIRSSEHRDHRLPPNGEPGEVGSYEDNMRLRSLSSPMAYQKQESALLDIQSFLVKNRPDHPQDLILMGRL